jgi:predicted nucleotidyltransferase component of viral defense system
MDPITIDQIKRLALISMFSDDDLMTRLVLKGGNAMDLVYRINGRASLDLDFSMENTITEVEMPGIRSKIERALVTTFAAENLVVFDFDFRPVPPELGAHLEEFWGGYKIEFKVIERDKHLTFSDKLDRLRVNALVVGPAQLKTFNIDISRSEFCRGKQSKEVDGYTVFVYTPAMLAFEKLRAVCQQMPRYVEIVKKHRAPRARDFYDIFLLTSEFTINFSAAENRDLVKNIFAAKRVPLDLIKAIPDERDFHRYDFASVRDTVPTTVNLKDYDFYFDYVVEQSKKLEPLWVV